MLQLLTKYLILNKRVSIPHVGSFVIEKQPATFNFGERLIHPPVYTINYKKEVVIDKPQITFITSSSQIDQSTAEQELDHFGKAWKAKIEKEPFSLNGFGTLEFVADQIVFHPKQIFTPLQPAHATKVIREHAQHNVLIGEQEVQSGSVNELLNTPKAKRSYVNLIALTLLLLAAIALGIYFFTNGFNINSTGNKTKITTQPAPPTYK